MERERTKLTAFQVWAVAFGGVVGWGSFMMPGTMFLKKAGPMGALIAMEFACFVMFIVASNYHTMLRRMPSTAGPYAWTKDAFGARHAVVCAWFLSFAYLVLVPQNATALAILSRILFRATLQTGFHYQLAGYDIYLSEIFLAEAAIVLFALVNMGPVRLAGRVQAGLALILMGGLFVILAGTVFSAGDANFHPLFHPGNGAVSGIFSVLAISPWAFVGFDVVPHLMGDFSPRTPKAPKIIMDISILCGGLAYVLLVLIAVSAHPEEFPGWVEYIDELPQLHRIVAIPTFHAAWKMLGRSGLMVLGFAALGALFTGILGFYMAASRLLLALALEGVLPAWFGRVNRHEAPANATIFIMGISMLAPFFGRAVLGWLVDMSSIGAAIAYGYTSLAARKFALQEGAASGHGVILGTLGFAFSTLFALLLLIPGLDSSLGKESYVCLLLWGLVGLSLAWTVRRHTEKIGA